MCKLCAVAEPAIDLYAKFAHKMTALLSYPFYRLGHTVG